VSYALIPHTAYRAAIRREHAIVVENNPGRKSRMVANAASLVGGLMRCPKCGAWLLAQPMKSGRGAFTVLRKQPSYGRPSGATNGKQPICSERNRKSGAAASRR
jgi:hypothetical protein